MKKLLVFLLFAMFLVSCQETDFRGTAIENPKKATTVNIQNTLDTAVIKIDTEDHKLYIVENGLAVREFNWYNNDDVTIPFGMAAILIFLVLLLLIMVFAFAD